MVITSEMRYGISALGIQYKDHAEPDELMVNTNTGKMYYKRDDGQIVNYDKQEYSSELIGLILKRALNDANINLTAENSHFVLYNTIDISGKTNLMNSNKVDLHLSKVFPVSASEGCIFVRVHGDLMVNAVASYLEASHASKNSNDTLKMAKIYFEVKELNPNGNIVTTVSYDVEYNTLTCIKLEKTQEDTVGFEVQVLGIRYPLGEVAFNELSNDEKLALKNLNLNNNIFESSCIDIISYVESLSNTNIFNDIESIKLEYVLPVSLVESMSVNSENEIVISKTKPDYKCIWGKILNG